MARLQEINLKVWVAETAGKHQQEQALPPAGDDWWDEEEPTPYLDPMARLHKDIADMAKKNANAIQSSTAGGRAYRQQLYVEMQIIVELIGCTGMHIIPGATFILGESI